jgi:hypothetical protein
MISADVTETAVQAKDSNSLGVGSILLSIAAIALAGAVGTVSLLQNVGELGPKVGDIVQFDPSRRASVDDKAQIHARPALAQLAGCVLDVRAMHDGGGSVIVEAKEPGDRPSFRVHWAGQRTSNARDCGSSAELLLDQDDIETLAMAAGGYGVSPKPGAPVSHARTSIP